MYNLTSKLATMKPMDDCSGSFSFGNGVPKVNIDDANLHL